MDASINLAICKYKSGLKQSDIYRQLNLKRSTQSKHIKLHKSTVCVEPRQKGRCGKKMKLNSRENRRESQKDPTLTAKEIQSAVGGNSSKLSIRTIRRYLHRSGRLCYRSTSCPSLGKKQRLNRYHWAKLKANWNKDDWRSGNKGRYVRRAKSCLLYTSPSPRDQA